MTMEDEEDTGIDGLYGALAKLRAEGKGPNSHCRLSSGSSGLKDHQIAQMVNAITKEVKPITKHQCLRELVSRGVLEYLESENLRLDHLNGPRDRACSSRGPLHELRSSSCNAEVSRTEAQPRC